MNVKPLPPPVGAPPPTAVRAGWEIQSGRLSGPQRVLLFGTGGIGKSSLAALKVTKQQLIGTPESAPAVPESNPSPIN